MDKTTEEGDVAPAFSLPGDDGTTIALADFKGKSVAIFFYPKDDTSGCTQEAQEFAALATQFDAAGCAVLGVSPDPTKSHVKFKVKYALTMALLSDEAKTTLEAFGVWREKSMYGRKYMGVERSTFLVDKDGRIAKAWRNVKVPGHAAEVLTTARTLGRERNL